MAVPTAMADLSVTASSNSPAGSEAPISTDDFHRAIQAILRHTQAKGSDIASATTTNLATATGEFVDVTGTTTITGLGTVAAGILRTVRFTGALTLTHNATSLILPGAANITTAANHVATFRSLGSGNWLCVAYTKADGSSIAGGAPFIDSTAIIKGSGDATKLLRIEADGITTATTRVWTSQNADGTVAYVDSQAFTGTPSLPTGTTATTQALTDSSTKLATTAFVAGKAFGASSVSTTTGGTSISFTSVIPSWANEFTVHVVGLSTNGTSAWIMQVGVGGTYVTTGYESFGTNYSSGGVAGASSTAGIPITNVSVAANSYSGNMTFKRSGSTNVWTAVGGVGSGSTVAGQGWGSIDAGGTLDSVRWTTAGGANTVDVNGGLSVTWRA